MPNCKHPQASKRNRANIKDHVKYHANREVMHAISRLKHRYGIVISNQAYETLCKQIRENRALLLRKESNEYGIWVVRYGDKELPVIYHNKTKHIVTFLGDKVGDKEILSHVYKSEPLEV